MHFLMKHLNPTKIEHLHDAVCKCSLGKGGYGNVKLYQCKEKGVCGKCDQLFVVKKLRSSKLNCVVKEQRERCANQWLCHEFNIGVLLDHPNIIKTIDIDIGKNCLIFEFFPSRDLFYVVNHTGYETLKTADYKKQTIDWIKQLFEAVNYLHKKGIAHMDIKLENILLDINDKKIKLIDFGQARFFDKETWMHGKHGTECYMSPECYEKECYDPSKVDVWSCGIVMFCLLTKQFPWQQANIHDAQFLKYYRSLLKSEFDESIKIILRECLELNSDTRKTAVEIVELMKLTV